MQQHCDPNVKTVNTSLITTILFQILNSVSVVATHFFENQIDAKVECHNLVQAICVNGINI
jgi:hypothetical protein